MLRKMKAGETSQSLPLFVQDTTSSTGAGLGSLVFNTASLAAKYRRQGQSSWTTISLVTMTLGTWTSAGFVSDGGPVTGGYELGIPDAAIAAGAEWVEVAIYGAANMLPVLIFIELDTLNYQASGGKVPATVAAADVTGNVTADVQTIKTQAVTAAAGVTFPTSIASPTNITAGTITTVTTLTNIPAAPTDWLTAAGVKADAVSKIQAGLSTYAGGDTAGVATLLARITGAVLLASNYTAPDNADIAAIAAKLPAGNIADQALVIAATDTILADLVKVLAAVYDSATVSSGVITLSNGATLTISAAGRVTA